MERQHIFDWLYRLGIILATLIVIAIAYFFFQFANIGLDFLKKITGTNTPAIKGEIIN